MTELEIMKVRCLLAEARASSAQRHNDFIAQYADLWQAMCEFWQSKAPSGTELPAELIDKAQALIAGHS